MYLKEAGKKGNKFVFDKLSKEWIPIFDKFLKEAINEVNFPKIVY